MPELTQKVSDRTMTRRLRFTSPQGLTATIKSLSGNDTRYTVSYDAETHTASCTCPDHQHRGRPCKHIQRLAKAIIRRNKRILSQGVPSSLRPQRPVPGVCAAGTANSRNTRLGKASR